MKKYFILYLFCFGSVVWAQLQSPQYVREWGTYLGPVREYLSSEIFTDTSGTLYIGGGVEQVGNRPASYYDQFVTSGMQNMNMAFIRNQFEARLLPSGGLLSFGYTGYSNKTGIYDSEYIVRIDGQNNVYKIHSASVPSALSATSGVWLETPLTDSNNVLLSKYASDGSLLWATFVPCQEGDFPSILIDTDDAGNIFLTSNTRSQSGISTAGAYQENFLPVYNPTNGSLYPNAYMVKLSPSGQRIWGSYYPSEQIFLTAVHGNRFYLMSQTEFNDLNIATPGTFQTAKSIGMGSLLAFDTDTGTKDWGTYVTPPGINVSFTHSMKTDETGIYLAGHTYDEHNGNETYFSTPGSYQSQHAGGSSDLFVSKFSLSGQRLWSTYLGTSATEITHSVYGNLDVKGNFLIITGNQLGGGPNLSTPSAYQTTKPGGVNDLFFALFDTDGRHYWTSYYGGPTYSGSIGYLASLSVKMLDENNFYLFGVTNASTGIATPGAFQPNIIGVYDDASTAFIAKFVPESMMSVSDTDLNHNLVLYNNPNNGSFSIKGEVLSKNQCYFIINDMAGRLAVKQKMSKENVQSFDFRDRLSKGNYVLTVYDKENQLLKSFKMVVK